jgi:hypothetical protein
MNRPGVICALLFSRRSWGGYWAWWARVLNLSIFTIDFGLFLKEDDEHWSVGRVGWRLPWLGQVG